MLSNFAFTLYEIFGYLIPGSLSFGGFVTLYWALFNSHGPMRVASFDPDVGAWAVGLAACYILGHASQAVGNKVLRGVEKKALEMESSPNIRQLAWEAAASLLGLDIKDIKAKWVYRVLDEYAIQNGVAGDRDMFIYREGFYRGTCIALFFVTACLAVRAFIPGTSIVFACWTLDVTWYESTVTLLVSAGVALLFLQRYRRFVEYRVTRAALAALVLMQKTAPERGSKPSGASK